jgi:hypothetical protein
MSTWLIRISIFLMVISFVPWLMVLSAPWWPMTGKEKAAAVTGLFIAAEILFWGGAAIGGTEVVRHRRAFMAILRRQIGPNFRRWTGLRHRKKTKEQ